MDTSKAVTHVSLCAGYGGIDIGLKRAIPNLRTIAFSEIEGFACANLVAKMEAGLLDGAPIWTNLKTFPWAAFRDRVDILSGGYPCQPFSAAGKRLGTSDPRHLWPFIADGIRIMRPKLCFFENVEGHISLGLRAVIEELGSIGYQVSWGIFSAREVGAPHQRKRVFILAHLRGAGLSRHWGFEQIGLAQGRTVEVGHVASTSEFGIQTVANKEWPSRAGEPQHEWEPERVVANAKSKRTDSGQQLCGEERRHRGTLPCESNESGEGVGNTNGIDRSASASGRINDTKNGSAGEAVGQRQVEPSLGRDANGTARGMDYAKLCVSGDNRTDELRLLGNGVVPATATRAFLKLLEQLK